MSEIGYEDDVELLEDDPLSMGATSLVDGIVDETEEAEEELEIPAEEGLVWLVKVSFECFPPVLRYGASGLVKGGRERCLVGFSYLRV